MEEGQKTDVFEEEDDIDIDDEFEEEEDVDNDFVSKWNKWFLKSIKP